MRFNIIFSLAFLRLLTKVTYPNKFVEFVYDVNSSFLSCSETPS